MKFLILLIGLILISGCIEIEEECNMTWKYDNLNFIPCQKDELGEEDEGCVGLCGLFGIDQENLNWSLSPMENCKKNKGHFIGFNYLYEDIAKERFEEVIPDCLLNSTDLE